MSNLRFPVTRFYRTFRCAPIFRYTSGVYTNGMYVHLSVYGPWGCPAHHLTCTAQLQGAYTNGGSVYICTCGVVEFRASENVTPALVDCCQRRERWQHIRTETSKRQKGEIWWNNSGMNHAFSFWFLTICFHEFFWWEYYLLLWITTTRQKLHYVCVIKQQKIQKIRFHLKKRAFNAVLHVQYISKAIRKST